MLPVAIDHIRCGVWCIFQRIVVSCPDAVFNLADFFTDADQCSNEAIQFSLRFRFGRLDHDRAGHRERDRWRVETIVHKTLGDIGFSNAGGRLDRADVENALMGDATVLAGVEHRVVLVQLLRDVIGVQDRHLRRFLDAGTTEHGKVHPGNGQDRG